MTKQREILRVHAIDHVVLTVQRIKTTCDFYQQVMGLILADVATWPQLPDCS